MGVLAVKKARRSDPVMPGAIPGSCSSASSCRGGCAPSSRQGTPGSPGHRHDLDWTISRPARPTNGPATGRLRARPRLPVTIRDSISRADVAQFVLGELKTGTHLLTAPTIAAT